MFERFTERARQVVVLAQEEARAAKHNYIGTEHLLLGLTREEEGIGARVLAAFGLTPDVVRADVLHAVGKGEDVKHGQIPFTPRAQKVLELALRESLSLGHNYIGTEHILLGLVRENEGVGIRILIDHGLDSEKIRNEVVVMLGGRTQRRKKPEPEEQPWVVSYQLPDDARKDEGGWDNKPRFEIQDGIIHFWGHPDEEDLIVPIQGLQLLRVHRKEQT